MRDGYMDVSSVIRDPSPEGAREVLEFAIPQELHGAIGLNSTESAMDYIFDTVESLLVAGVEVIKVEYIDRIYEMVTNILGAAFA